MTPVKAGLLAAVTAAVLASGWQYQGWQQRREEVARLRTENERLRLQVNARRDGQLGHGRARAGEQDVPVASSRRNVRGGAMGQPGAEVLDEYRNEGMASPLAALQTLAWACDRADAVLMEKLLVYDEDARRKILAHLAAQSTGSSARMPSIEAGAAALYIEDGMHHPYPAARILERARFEQLRPGRVLLHLPGANGDGYQFQQTSDGWKLAVTLKVVDDYIQESARRASRR